MGNLFAKSNPELGELCAAGQLVAITAIDSVLSGSLEDNTALLLFEAIRQMPSQCLATDEGLTLVTLLIELIVFNYDRQFYSRRCNGLQVANFTKIKAALLESKPDYAHIGELLTEIRAAVTQDCFEPGITFEPVPPPLV